MRSRCKPWLGAAALVLLSGAAWAGESAETDVVELGPPIASQALDQHRARQNTHLEMNLQETNATVQGNVAVDVISGHNIVKDNAFSNASGLNTVIQNSGSNNAIQASTILNLKMQQ